MKTLLFAVSIVLSVVSLADNSVKRPKIDKDSPEYKAKMEALEKRVNEKAGGFIVRKSEGNFAIIDCQKRYPREDVKKRGDNLVKTFKIPFAYKQAESYQMYKQADGARFTIVVADDANLPMSVISPEAGWGLVNVANLGGDAKRFHAEFTRVAILTLGGGVSQSHRSAMQPIFKPSDLDAVINENVSFDVISPMILNMKANGVIGAVRVTYRQACREGWAPDPTNDIQKAIWEKVHSEKERGPVNGIKIAPPNKK